MEPERSRAGDIMPCWLGDGVVRGEPWLDMWSPASERAWLPFLTLVAASAAAVAAAASSIVPVWWFWCRVRVVRRVNVFWQSA